MGDKQERHIQDICVLGKLHTNIPTKHLYSVAVFTALLGLADCKTLLESSPKLKCKYFFYTNLFKTVLLDFAQSGHSSVFVWL